MRVKTDIGDFLFRHIYNPDDLMLFQLVIAMWPRRDESHSTEYEIKIEFDEFFSILKFLSSLYIYIFFIYIRIMNLSFYIKYNLIMHLSNGNQLLTTYLYIEEFFLDD